MRKIHHVMNAAASIDLRNSVNLPTLTSLRESAETMPNAGEDVSFKADDDGIPAVFIVLLKILRQTRLLQPL